MERFAIETLIRAKEDIARAHSLKNSIDTLDKELKKETHSIEREIEKQERSLSSYREDFDQTPLRDVDVM